MGHRVRADYAGNSLANPYTRMVNARRNEHRKGARSRENLSVLRTGNSSFVIPIKRKSEQEFIFHIDVVVIIKRP